MTPPNTFDENDCIARAQRGDVAAFSELVARHQDRIYRFLLRLTRSHDDALDLAQETFIHAWTSLDRWQARARFSTWLFQIARNQAIDLLRRTQRVDFVEFDADMGDSLADSAPTPEETLHSTQRLHALERALQSLPTEHREILLLREIEDLSYDEMAAVLDIQLGTVKSRIARARTALLEKMPR